MLSRKFIGSSRPRMAEQGGEKNASVPVMPRNHSSVRGTGGEGIFERGHGPGSVLIIELPARMAVRMSDLNFRSAGVRQISPVFRLQTVLCGYTDML